MPNIISGKNRVYIITITVIIVAVIAALTLLLIPEKIIIEEGQNIAVTVISDSFEALYGYQFQLNYARDELEFEGTLTSKINDISTIFSKTMDGYELVGATMIGKKDGVSGKNKAVCEMIFRAKKEIELKDLEISISDVNIVQSDMNYLENIQGWKLKTSAGS